jgi:co-chaperonin GroES (HSP10)
MCTILVVHSAGRRRPLRLRQRRRRCARRRAVKLGDRILFGKHSGKEVTLDGEEHLVMKEEDVLGIVGS